MSEVPGAGGTDESADLAPFDVTSTEPVPEPSTNRLAITAMVLAASGILLLGVGSISAIVVGAIALVQLSRPGNTERGRGLAIGGIVLGVAVLAILLTFILVPTLRGVTHPVNCTLHPSAPGCTGG